MYQIWGTHRGFICKPTSNLYSETPKTPCAVNIFFDQPFYRNFHFFVYELFGFLELLDHSKEFNLILNQKRNFNSQKNLRQKSSQKILIKSTKLIYKNVSFSFKISVSATLKIHHTVYTFELKYIKKLIAWKKEPFRCTTF